MTINMVVYVSLISFWLLLFFLPKHTHDIDIAVNIFLSFIYVMAAVGFISYGGRLYLMLKQFPIESRGRSTKLKEVSDEKVR